VQRLGVEHRTANQQRDPAACSNLCRYPLGVGDETPDCVGCFGFDEIDQVVRTPGPFGRIRLRGSNRHAAIDQRRVDADHFDGKAFGQRQREGCLPARGRTEDRR